MDEILPGLFLGAIEDSQLIDSLRKNDIKYILSIHDFAEPGDINEITYKCIKIDDSQNADISQYFQECIEFIHNARINSQNILVHCFSGKSRSATICIAYIMFNIRLNFLDAFNCVRTRRRMVFPNFGFQKQLKDFEENILKQVDLVDYCLKDKDVLFCRESLEIYKSQKNIQKAKLNESKGYILKNVQIMK